MDDISFDLVISEYAPSVGQETAEMLEFAPTISQDMVEMITCVRQQSVPEKNVHQEYRTIRDLEAFLRTPSVLFLKENPLGPSEKSLEDIIVDKILSLDSQSPTSLKSSSSSSENPYSNLKNSYQNLRQEVMNAIWNHVEQPPPLQKTARLTMMSMSDNTKSINDPVPSFKNILQGFYVDNDNDNDCKHDHSWCCVFASVDSLVKRKILFVRLTKPTNFGPTLNSVRLMAICLVPSREKSTKSAYETARTFATIFAKDPEIRDRLFNASDEKKFIQVIKDELNLLKTSQKTSAVSKSEKSPFRCSFGRGINENVRRRLKYYWSDFRDGLDSWPTLAKVSSSTLSLFFACILPCVAFGVLDEINTDGKIGPKEALLGQAIGGLLFALLSGQPLVIIATTAPLCLYTAITHRIAQNLGVDFFDLFAMVGVWNTLFLVAMSWLDLSQLMQYCTRSTEEIFATFIFFAFTSDAIKELIQNFQKHYCFHNEATRILSCDFAPEKSILFLFLMFGTLALGLMLFNFSKTPYLSQFFRVTLADYSLPLAVITFTLIASYAFSQVKPESFELKPGFHFRIATFTTLNIQSIFLAMVLGFALSLLFFIDQNVSAALVSAPSNRLRKGDAYHWDLFVVAILNLILSLIGYPWMHGILPHSPMHARSLADVIMVNDQGKNQMMVVRSRETRITGLLIHLLITLVVIFIPEIVGHIPISVLCGLFLYCAVSTLRENSLYERTLLLFTEQTQYPPNHYLRKCPQRIVHLFTLIQLVQLAIICGFGFARIEYVQLVFPVVIAMLIPVRWLVLPRLIDESYLSIIDSKHLS